MMMKQPRLGYQTSGILLKALGVLVLVGGLIWGGNYLFELGIQTGVEALAALCANSPAPLVFEYKGSVMVCMRGG